MVQYIAKFKNASPALKSSMALLFANLVLKALSLISGPIFTRIMPQTEYGIVSTYASWLSMLSVFITLSLASGVFNNGMLEFKKDRDSFEFSLLIISSISTIAYFFVYLFFQTFINKIISLPSILIYLMFADFFFVPAYQYWSCRQRYEFKYKLLTNIIIGIALISTILAIVAVLVSPDNQKAISKIVVSEMVNIVVGVIFYIVISVKARFKCNAKYCVYALKFNLPLIPHYMSMYVLDSSDRILISKIVGTAATAIYSVAYTVASVIIIVWQSIDASLSPWIYEKLGKGDYKSVKLLTTKIVLLFGILCLSCTLIAPEIIAILAPPNYYSGVYVISSVTAGVFFIAVYSLYMRVELYFKNTIFATIATTIAAISNLVLNLILIKIIGFIAAGYTTMVCYALLYLLHYFNVKRKGFAYILDNKNIFIVSIVVVLASSAITLLYPFAFIRYLVIIAGIITVTIKRKSIMDIVKQMK